MSNSKLVTKKVPAYAGNYTAGRQGNKINKIVIHHAAGTNFDSIGAEFQKVGRGGSAHYGVGGKQIAQYVDESNTAWHASNWDVNCTSVGIETCNSTGRVNGNDNDPNSWKVSDETFNTLIKLVADIAKRNGIGKLVKGKNLTWHSMYADTFCPGNYLRNKMDELVSRANALISDSQSNTFKVGDKVTSSSNGFASSDRTGAVSIIVTTPTEIKRINNGAKCPYLVGNIGWFAGKDLKKTSGKVTFKVGDKVKIKKGAPAYNGVALAAFVYNNVYRIDELNGKRAVLDVTGICTAVNTDNLIKM